MFEEAWTALLNSVAGSPPLYDVFPVVLPQAPERPAVVYQMISGPRGYTQDGPMSSGTFRMQVDCYGTTYDDAKAVRNAVATIDGNNWTFLGVRLQGCYIDQERDLYEPGLNEAGPKLFRKTLDFIVTADQR